MAFVLSLIAPVAKALDAATLKRARRALDEADATHDAPDWLAHGEAVDIACSGGDAVAACDAVRAALADRAVDVNALPAEGRRKRLLVADMDSTMIRQECIDELAAEIGMREAVAVITERAMRGEIAFEPALRERVALLRGLEESVIERVLATRIEIMPGARILVATMRAHGAATALVSGGFTAFVEPVAARIGFEATRANRLIVEAGRFAGTVAEPILGAAAKEEALLAFTAEHDLAADETLAVGDGANDAPMILRAGLGVAFHAKPTLRRVAGAIVDHADLTALLYLQGYRRDEFAAA